MRKLAAVRTGQPTQGLGTVPDGNPPSFPTHPPALDDGDPASPPPSINPRSYASAPQAAMAASWLSLKATELEVRKYFKSIPVPSGLELLAKMRKQCDLAAETLQQRIDEGNTERCSGCNKTLEEAHKSGWLMVGSDVDATTGVPMPYRYCGPQCIRERNREKMLPPEQRNKLRFDGAEEGDIR